MTVNGRTVSPGGSRWSWGTPTSTTKHPPGSEVRGGVLEAGDLIVLRGQVVDRVVDQVGERELARHLGGGEVAERDLDRVGAGLRPQLLHHLARKVDAAHRDAAPGERQRDPAGADAELQRSAVSGQPGQEVDGRLDHGRVEHLRGGGVVRLATRSSK